MFIHYKKKKQNKIKIFLDFGPSLQAYQKSNNRFIDLKIQYYNCVYFNSADVAQLYRGEKDPEKLESFEEASDFDETSGFAIVINGHSLVHCLTPELETRYLKMVAKICLMK